MPVRYPRPLSRGDRIAVTSPSSGVPTALHARLRHAISTLELRGFEVVVGRCMDGEGVVSASAQERATELMGLLLDPEVRAVVPPWGGDLAVELLPHLDFEAVSRAEPTWLVGYSDISTLMLPLTALTGIATLHGQNLLDTPYRVPKPLMSWLDAATRPAGGRLVQGPSERHRSSGFDDWQQDPVIEQFTLDSPGTWRLLDRDNAGLRTQGRLIGGCIETVSVLAGTRYGDLAGFVDAHAPEGLLLYLEAADSGALDIARCLWRMRLAGWFDHANAVLLGRTYAPDSDGYTQQDATRSAVSGLAVPVIIDVDCGHVAPHLALVNGAIGEITVSDAGSTLVQHLHA